MSKRRMIDPAFWQSETMASLTIPQRFLFIGLFSNADDQGRLRSHPALLRNQIFPFDDPDFQTIKADLAAIEETGSIKRYTADGKEYIQITGWWDYQKPQWAYPSDIPAPDGWQDRLRYRQDNQVIQENWDGSGGFDEGGSDNEPDQPDQPEPPNNGKEPEKEGEALPNAIGKLLANPLANATELELELDRIEDDKERARVKTEIIQTVYQNNIHMMTPIISQDMNSPPCNGAPVSWWIDAVFIAAGNNVRKWPYVRSILDRSLQAGIKPSELGPPGQRKNGGTNGNHGRAAPANRDSKPEASRYAPASSWAQRGSARRNREAAST